MTTHPHHPTCPGGKLCTLDTDDTDAEIARRRGWSVGTRIEGMKYGERREIEIAALGREGVLAVEAHWTDRKWRLHARCWGEVKP